MSHSIDESYDVYREHFPKASVSHTCDACKRPIPKGHVYARVFIVFEGEAETVKRCLTCQALHKHLRTLDPGEMWPDERLDCGIEYSEHWNREPPEHIAKLAFLTAEEAQQEFAEKVQAWTFEY